jgi:hypothetical protein
MRLSHYAVLYIALGLIGLALLLGLVLLPDDREVEADSDQPAAIIVLPLPFARDA